MFGQLPGNKRVKTPHQIVLYYTLDQSVRTEVFSAGVMEVQCVND